MRVFRVLFIALLLPEFAFARSPMIFPVSASDLSLQYFYFIFGPITDIAPALMQPNSITVLIHIFIAAIISLSLLGISFVGIKSVFTGSSDGHLLGERMPSLDGPVKMGGAIMLLIPDQYGFCSIQYFVMWFILNGVGLANQLWLQVINNYTLGNTLVSDKIVMSSSRTEDVAKSLMYAALSIAYVQQSKSEKDLPYMIPNAEVTDGSGLDVYVCDLATLGTAPCDQYKGIIQYPVKDPGNNKVDSTETLTASSLTSILENIMTDMAQDPLIQYALAKNLTASALTQEAVEQFFGQDYCSTVLSAYSDRIQAELEPYARKSRDLRRSLADMTSEGWMSAAYYYWDLYGGIDEDPGAEAILTDFAPTTSSTVRNSIYGYALGDSSKNDYYMDYSSNQSVIASYIDTIYIIKNKNASGSPSYNKIITDATSYGVDDMFAMTGTNMLLAAFISSDMDFYHLDYDFTVDRYSAFIKSNYKVVTNVISFMQGLLMFGFVLALFCVFSGINPIFFSIIFALMAAFFLILPFLSAIATTGAMGSVYAAALPGLIFGAAAFSWFLKVVEAVIAAPIVAMVMVFPSEDSESKLEHVLMQLVVLALRPALMILGFVIATKVCQLSIMFIGGAFNQIGNSITSITSESGGSSSGGIIFLMMMYEFTTMTTITFISRSFNIINVLPDSVFAAIGVQSSDHEADQLISGFESAGNKGAKALAHMITAMGGIASSMNDLSKKTADHRAEQRGNKDTQK